MSDSEKKSETLSISQDGSLERQSLVEELEAKKTEVEAWRHQCRYWIAEAALIQSLAGRPVWLFKQLCRRLTSLLDDRHRYRKERERIAYSGLFSSEWYLSQNPDVMAAGREPLNHFVRHGALEGRAASPHFDTLEHIRHHPSLLKDRQNPLIHWLDQHQIGGSAESIDAGASPLFQQLFDQARGHEANYLQLDERSLKCETRIRAIAFYLPQFHPIEENDRWWGKGFTEWTNVSKAVPQFLGHNQPRLPGELGYYDLRIPEVQERQVELAKMHGIEAFCFHYYWFSGRKRLLEKPIDNYVANDSINFPFCICWANENWTRRWDGLENDVLMEQHYDPEDDRELIEDLAPLLKDSRYLRVNGCPVLIVYRVDLLPDARRTVGVWRDYCREKGIGELHLIAAQSFGIGDPAPYGFDAAVEFPPHDTYSRRIESEQYQLNPEYQGQVYDYADLVFKQLAKPRPDYKCYRTVFPGWDNEARKPGRGHVFHGANPSRYQQWLAGACREADRLEGDDKLVFINAWNEWAEGAYLEPDRHFGYGYLDATRKVLEQFPSNPVSVAQQFPAELTDLAAKRHDTAVILHLFHTDLWGEIYQSLSALGGAFDLYVSIPEQAEEDVEARIRRDVPEAIAVRLINRGRDVAPFLTLLRAIRPLGYNQLLKIHSKRSLHRGDGDLWRREFLGRLLGSRSNTHFILEAFDHHSDIGMIGPSGHWLDYRRYWGDPDSPSRTRDLLDSIGSSIELEQLGFFAGSMFWCRPEAMSPLLDNITLDDFEPETGQTDGTLAHALERIFAGACQTAGMRVTDTANPAGSEPSFTEHYPYAVTSKPLATGGRVPDDMTVEMRVKRGMRHAICAFRRALK